MIPQAPWDGGFVADIFINPSLWIPFSWTGSVYLSVRASFMYICCVSSMSRLYRAYARIALPKLDPYPTLTNFIPKLITLITFCLRLSSRMNLSTIRHRIDAALTFITTTTPPPHCVTIKFTLLSIHVIPALPPHIPSSQLVDPTSTYHTCS